MSAPSLPRPAPLPRPPVPPGLRSAAPLPHQARPRPPEAITPATVPQPPAVLLRAAPPSPPGVNPGPPPAPVAPAPARPPRLGRDLSFTDLYFYREDAKNTYYLPKRSMSDPDPGPRDTPAHLLWEVEEISRLVEEDRQKRSRRGVMPGELTLPRDGAIEYHDLRMRYRHSPSINGEVFCLRPIAGKPRPAHELGVESRTLTELLNMGDRKGLILIIGPTGEGKTTTCAAILNYWLTQRPSVAYTVEDPVEYTFQGRVTQFQVEQPSDWKDGLETAMRFHPRFIFLGEVRTADAAAQLIQASTTGHTCLATIHGGSIRDGLERLITMAEEFLGKQAAPMLAGSLIGCGFQRLGADSKPRIQLLVTEEAESCQVKNIIRDRKLESLNGPIEELAIRLYGKAGPPGPNDQKVENNAAFLAMKNMAAMRGRGS